VISFIPEAWLPPRKEPPASITQDVKYTPLTVWMLWKREKSLTPPWESNTDSLVVQPIVAIPTEFYVILAFLFPSHLKKIQRTPSHFKNQNIKRIFIPPF
jgi:hypothetical protein